MSDVPLYPVKLVKPYGNINSTEIAGFPFGEAVEICQRGIAVLVPGIQYPTAFDEAAKPIMPPAMPVPAEQPAEQGGGLSIDPEEERRQAEEAERLAAEVEAEAARKAAEAVAAAAAATTSQRGARRA